MRDLGITKEQLRLIENNEFITIMLWDMLQKDIDDINDKEDTQCSQYFNKDYIKKIDYPCTKLYYKNNNFKTDKFVEILSHNFLTNYMNVEEWGQGLWITIYVNPNNHRFYFKIFPTRAELYKIREK